MSLHYVMHNILQVSRQVRWNLSNTQMNSRIPKQPPPPPFKKKVLNQGGVRPQGSLPSHAGRGEKSLPKAWEANNLMLLSLQKWMRNLQTKLRVLLHSQAETER